MINLNVSTATRWGLNALILFSVILALYLGSTIFIPTILSVLLAAMLWPMVTWLNQRGVPLPGAGRRAPLPLAAAVPVAAAPALGAGLSRQP